MVPRGAAAAGPRGVTEENALRGLRFDRQEYSVAAVDVGELDAHTLI